MHLYYNNLEIKCTVTSRQNFKLATKKLVFACAVVHKQTQQHKQKATVAVTLKAYQEERYVVSYAVSDISSKHAALFKCNQKLCGLVAIRM